MASGGVARRWPFALAILAAVVLAAVLMAALAHGPEVYPGVDGLELADTLTGRRIGVVTHQAAVSRDGRLTTLVLTSLPDVQLSALFAPEHGLGDDAPGSLPARAPIYSLFGRLTQPTRQMLSADTGLPWINPSPGLLTDDSPFYYATTGAIDGTNLWNGVSTDSRFQVILAPWIDGARLAERLNGYRLPGVTFSGSSVPLPFNKKIWSGVRLQVTDRSTYRPLTTAVYVLVEIHKMYGGQLIFRLPLHGPPLFDQVWGTRQVRLGILRGDDAATIVARWQPGLQKFLALRQQYLLYPDVRQPETRNPQPLVPAIRAGRLRK